MRLAQIVALILIGAVYILAIPCAWLGLSPEVGFLDFFLQAKSLLPIAGLAGALAAFFAYILGWNPSQEALQWIRKRVVVPVMTTPRDLLVVCLAASFLLIAATRFLVTFDDKPYPKVFDLIWADNFQGADRAIAEADLAPHVIADLLIINDSLRQDTLTTSQAQSKPLCQIYYDYLAKRPKRFRRVWWRYAYAYAKGSCLRGLEDLRGSVAEFESAKALARWLDVHEERRSARKVAAIHFYDNAGTAGIPTKADRLRYIVRLVATDPNETAQRMLGSSYFQLGEYAKAIRTWTDSLDAVPKEETLERKKLMNNIALGYAAQSQPVHSAKISEEALALAFARENENERREQVRLLATHTWALVQQGRCSAAANSWAQRQSLMEQKDSVCSALLESQVLACLVSTEPSASNRSGLLKAVLSGVGQKPETFVDRSSEALKSLVTQATLTFRECYLGLEYPATLVTKGLEGEAHG